MGVGVTLGGVVLEGFPTIGEALADFEDIVPGEHIDFSLISGGFIAFRYMGATSLQDSFSVGDNEGGGYDLIASIRDSSGTELASFDNNIFHSNGEIAWWVGTSEDYYFLVIQSSEVNDLLGDELTVHYITQGPAYHYDLITGALSNSGLVLPSTATPLFSLFPGFYQSFYIQGGIDTPSRHFFSIAGFTGLLDILVYDDMGALLSSSDTSSLINNGFFLDSISDEKIHIVLHNPTGTIYDNILALNYLRVFYKKDIPIITGLTLSVETTISSGIMVSRDSDVFIPIKVSKDTNISYLLGFLANEVSSLYSLRHLIHNTVKSTLDLSVLSVHSETQVVQGVSISRDTTVPLTYLGLIKKDSKVLWNMTENIYQSFHSAFDISPYTSIHRDFKSIYTLYDPGYTSLDITFSAKIGEEEVQLDNLNLSLDESSYCWTFSATLSDSESYQKAVPGSILTLVLNNDTYYMKIDSRNRSSEWGKRVYTVEGRSPTSVLGEGAEPLYKTWDSITAQEAVDELSSGISNDFQIDDWTFPAQVLTSDGETPVSIIKKISEASGGVLFTKADGSLYIGLKYKVTPPEYNINTFDRALSDYDDIINMEETGVILPGYNAVYVSTEPTNNHDTFSLSEIDQDRVNLTTTIRAVIYPFVESLDLFNSFDSSVIITPQNNPIIEEREPETIEIIDGAGSVSAPIEDILSHEYLKNDLGAIEFDGTSITTDTPGNTLLKITYTTQYHDFQVTTDVPKMIQVYTEDII